MSQNHVFHLHVSTSFTIIWIRELDLRVAVDGVYWRSLRVGRKCITKLLKGSLRPQMNETENRLRVNCPRHQGNLTLLYAGNRGVGGYESEGSPSPNAPLPLLLTTLWQSNQSIFFFAGEVVNELWLIHRPIAEYIIIFCFAFLF